MSALDTKTSEVPAIVGGRYQILGLLGVGGMGSVYRARDVELDEQVALKMLRRELVDQPGMLERFRREVKLARRVTHRNVARTFDIGEHGGEKFLTMELVEGGSLSSLMREHGALSVAKVIEIAEGICAGLSAAHAAGVVHRDLKPDNVLLASDGRVVITDFGIARALEGAAALATLGALVGTPAYMAPEQVEQKPNVDARADLYALGAMLFEMVTGELPFRGGNAVAVAIARLTQPPPDPRPLRPDLPDGVVRLVRRLMSRAPEERHRSAEEVAAALSSLTLPQMEATVAMEGPLVPSSPSPTALAETTKSVAVLPIRNAGGADDDYLADGLTEDLIDTLSMTRGLRVRSRGGVIHLRGATGDPRELGRELGVQVVVDGTLRRSGPSIRATVRLVSVADGFQLWARRFDRAASDILAVGDEAARAIAAALTVEEPVATHAQPSDPVALDLYLRARHAFHRFGRDSNRQAVQLYEQALRRAPDDPAILAGAAVANARLWFYGGAEARANSDAARRLAERAVALSPNTGEPHVALGVILHYSGDPAGAARELGRALRLAPGHVDAHDLMGKILIEAGALEVGVRHLQTALVLEPSLTQSRWDVARVHALRGDWVTADELLATPPVDEAAARGQWMHRLRLAGWRRDRALMTRLIDTPPPGDIEAGFFETVRQMLASVAQVQPPLKLGPFQDTGEAAARRRNMFSQIEVECAAFIGDRERAIRALTRAVDNNLFDLAWADRCPLLRELHGDPGFDAQHDRLRARAAQILAVLDEPV